MAILRIVSAATLAASLLAACAVLPDAAPTDTLIGAWRVEDVAGTGVVDNSNLTVEFSETGQVAGSAGCNRYTGAYALEAGALRVTPLGVTRRMCPEALMLQEARFVDALQNATQVETQADGAVALTSASGRILMRRRDGIRTPAVVAAAPSASSAPTSSASTSTAPLYAPAADPLAPQAASPTADTLGAPLFSTTTPSPTALPPSSTSSYPLAGAGAPGAPLYPQSTAPTYAPPAYTTPAAPVITPTQSYTPPAYIPPAPSTRITAAGEISLADAAPLPADATLRVQIRDVSRVGAPATVLGEETTSAAGGGPFPFSVSAPTSVIAANARLTLFAQVLSGNRLLYITDTSNTVPASGATGMRIRLANAAPVSSRPAPVPTPAPAPAYVPPPAYTPPPATTPPAAPTTSPAWYGDISGARPFLCRTETFRLSFEERVAYLTTADGAVARLARVESDADAGAPQMFSNARLTLIKDVDATGRERVRFARGRAAMVTCSAQ